MDISPTSTPTIIGPPDPPPPSQHFNLSPLEFLLALFAVIIIPTLIYTFFLFLRCPPNPFDGQRQTSSDSSLPSAAEELADTNRSSSKEAVTDVKYKEEHVKSVGGECPVCLSAFADGEEVRLLTACKHSFHDSCIDMWLNSHSSCPVCRASVAVKKSGRGTSAVAGEDDFRQGLPDSASLV